MKSIPWSVAIILLAMLGALSFLVYEGKLDSTLLISLVSAITGGGLFHLGGAASVQQAQQAPPVAPTAAPAPVEPAS